MIGAKGVYNEKKQLIKENEQLRQENLKVKELEAKVEASQEDGQSLRSDIYRVHQDLVGTWLKGVSKQINLDSYSRVSIYYENQESFYLLSRYSINPKLAKTYKQKFGLNEGVISQAWQHGEHSEDDSPEYVSDKNGYIEYMIKHYGYSREVLELINMKSCRYFALAITEAGDNIGVIIFESERKDSFSNEIKTQIRDYCSDHQSHLCNFVKDGTLYDKSISSNKALAAVDNDADVLDMLGGSK